MNNQGKSCPNGTGQGTFDDPYCTIGVAIKTATKPVIVFAGNGYQENLSIIRPAGETYTLDLRGVGKPVLSAAGPGPVLVVDRQGAAKLAISIDGFTVQGGTDTTPNSKDGHGIQCGGSVGNTSTTQLTLVRSTVQGNAQNGITASNCDLTLDQDRIVNNAQGGILLQSSDFTLTNLLVVDNGTATSTGSMVKSGSNFGGINVASAGPKRNSMVNLTVVNNQMRNGLQPSAGIGCSAGVTLSNTVVFGNTGGGAELDPMTCIATSSAFSCAATDVACTSIVIMNNNVNLASCQSTDLFIAPGDYEPKAGAVDSCTLVDAGTSVNAPDHDLIGTPRPQGAGFDIGCYEAIPISSSYK